MILGTGAAWLGVGTRVVRRLIQPYKREKPIFLVLLLNKESVINSEKQINRRKEGASRSAHLDLHRIL